MDPTQPLTAPQACELLDNLRRTLLDAIKKGDAVTFATAYGPVPVRSADGTEDRALDAVAYSFRVGWKDAATADQAA